MNFKAWEEVHRLNRSIREILDLLKQEYSYEILSGEKSTLIDALVDDYMAHEKQYQEKRKALGVK